MTVGVPNSVDVSSQEHACSCDEIERLETLLEQSSAQLDMLKLENKSLALARDWYRYDRDQWRDIYYDHVPAARPAGWVGRGAE